MPSLKAIRTRIGSVKNTQKITRAMKLVAAAKLRRAQDGIVAARPYANRLREVIAELAARTLAPGEEPAHPLLARREPRRVQLLVLTSDRGLAGGFNANVLRRAERYLLENRDVFADARVSVVGRKGRDYFRRRGVPLVRELVGVPPTAAGAAEHARALAAQAIADFAGGELDAIHLVYNEFKSAIQQRVVVEALLPIAPSALGDGRGLALDFEYEPSRAALLEHLLPRYVEVEIFRALLESTASEFGARMSAMDSATKNAGEMMGRLTLLYNRARQAAITKELMEIIGGAEALKG